MIVQRQRTDKIAVKQEDHAALAAFILENWSAHSFPNHPDRANIITATREHDMGWRTFDALPRLDAKTQLPVDFTKITPQEANAIWMEASEKFIESQPFVALLITHHAYTLHEATSRRDSKWKQFFIDFARRRAALRDQLGLTHNDVEHPYSFVRMADWFSLQFCLEPKLGQENPERYAGYTVKREESSYLFRPYPFSSRKLSYTLPVYPMPPKGFENEKDLSATLKKPVKVEIQFGALERWE
ncbi:MAG: DUF3891 family protein [bacterium]|nr:DUF3891 family protein [Candidatus Kapabacteria bacterium]